MKAKFKLTSDPGLAAQIVKGLNRNEEKHGARYCPCKLEKTEENICPCIEYKETGDCHCKVFEE